MPIRLEDIAQKLGISVTTVSLALKGHPRITERRRKQVLRVARRMGYRPNLLARALATGRAGIVGLIVSDNANPFYAEVIRGVEDVVTGAGMSVILCNTYRDPKREGMAVRMLLSRKVDGLILAPTAVPGGIGEEDRYLRALAKEGFPLVIITRSTDDPYYHTVTVDNVSLAQRAVRHLISRGHQSICYLGSESRTDPDEDRLQGYRHAMKTAGIAHSQPLVWRGPPTFEGGYTGMKSLLETGADFTALFTFNDVMAIGGMRALREAGLRVPTDVAVLGCDDVAAAKFAYVSLSTMRIPKYEIGKKAAEVVLSSIRGEMDSVQKVILEADLVERESTRPSRRRKKGRTPVPRHAAASH